MKHRIPIVIGALAASLACTETATDLQLEIIAQGAGFSGQYTVDDDEATDFEVSASTSDIYRFTESVSIVDSLVIDVFPSPTADGDDDSDATDMTGLTCRIKDVNGDTAYEESYTISTTMMKTFEFSVDDLSASE